MFRQSVVVRAVDSQHPDVEHVRLDVQANGQRYERDLVERDGTVLMDVSEPGDDAPHAA